MKKFNFLFAAVLMVVAAVFTSCTEEDGTTPAPEVTVTNTKPANGYVPGETVVFTIKAIANNVDLTMLKIDSSPIVIDDASSLDASTSNQIVDLAKATNNKASYEIVKNNTTFTLMYNYVIPAGLAVNSEITVKFTVTDKDGGTKTQAANVIKIEAAATAGVDLNNENNGEIYHILGSGKGAWDLVANVAKAKADAVADKDMINQTDNLSGSFLKEWKAGNATKFVKANSFDYAAATDVSAETAYAAGTATDHVMTVAKDDIYIAKLRGGDNYAVIKIVDIKDDGAVSNSDYIKFTYKKKPAQTGKSTAATALINY